MYFPTHFKRVLALREIAYGPVARVLLMDPLTQAFLAMILGVRRASVREVASHLQGAGQIHYPHARITILDRDGLEGAACEG